MNHQHEEVRTKLTPEQALRLIDHLAAQGELDFVDFKNKESVSNKASELFGKIYMVAHAHQGNCRHPEWEEWAYKAYKESGEELEINPAKSHE